MDTLIILDMVYISSDLLCTDDVCVMFWLTIINRSLVKLTILAHSQLFRYQYKITLRYRMQSLPSRLLDAHKILDSRIG